MRLTCDQKDLSSALNVVNRAVSVNNTLPVLNNIHVKATGKKMAFYATNLEIALTCSIDADVENEGEVTIPAKIFTSYVNLLPNGKVTIKVESGNRVLISTKNSQTHINGLSSEDFPAVPDIKKEGQLVLDVDLLQEAIEQTVFAASSNTARPILAGVLFSVQKSTMELVATDSYRLAERNLTLEKDSGMDVKVVLPGHTVQELGKILGSTSEKHITITFSKDQVMFEVGSIKLFSRVIEGNFPDYKKIIPTSHKTHIEVDVNDFVMAVKRVSILVAEANNNIKISVTNDGKMILSTGETHIGDSTAEIDVKIEGQNNKISLNAQYLYDVLQVLKSGVVVIELDSKITPALIKALDKHDYTHIIMPLKV